jgi:hypothetical protein
MCFHIVKTIIKCYQGIVIGRYDYAGLTVRGTGPNITAIRLSEDAPLLTNWQMALYNSFFGLKVFMDAHSTVTAEEGDRYPLGPPSFESHIAWIPPPFRSTGSCNRGSPFP